MDITSAKYGDPDGNGTNDYIILVSNSETIFVPLDPANRHYAEIMRQVEAGDLTIAEAD
jgi:hypothetical protein